VLEEESDWRKRWMKRSVGRTEALVVEVLVVEISDRKC
jgi:hypothetical protein